MGNHHDVGQGIATQRKELITIKINQVCEERIQRKNCATTMMLGRATTVMLGRASPLEEKI